jgi:hypothetical protein
MEPNDLTEFLPADWKWQALFERPSTFDREWLSWLAGAQRAEQEALLRYWARRSTSGATATG